ncbi:MAG: sigma-70 family RNA polymerase sigma factor [Firmicutes bacterium]|nr:sigma-70 family RNA polymerase sigma factor [Bacillota bacterium]
MTGQKALDKFDVVYNESYKDISRYVVLNANNIGDVKDILQNIYLEVYKNIDKVSDKNYVFGIAKNVLKKYYRFKFLRKDDTEITDNIKSNINLEKTVMDKFDTELVWKYLKKKNNNIAKIIYLYYYEDFTIKEIANSLNLTESNVKNYIYRTLKELRRINND